MSEASLDLDAVAHLLHVTPSTVRRWLRQGLLHPSAPGGRFARPQLEDWARRRGLSLGQRERAEVRHPADLLADAFERGCVLHHKRVDDARAAIRLLVEGLPQFNADAHERLAREVLERESMASTALGGGVALPHPRTPPGDLVTAPCVATLFLEQGADWVALDGAPVHTVFLLLSPDAGRPRGRGLLRASSRR